jgi:hypothetical protein
MNNNQTHTPEEPLEPDVPEIKQDRDDADSHLHPVSQPETVEPQTQDHQPQPLPMEVHHPHHLTHKKKWTEYILEFLMLFFAVFLGFTAENIREHQIERHREHEFAQSLIRDIKIDTTNLKNAIQSNIELKRNYDSLLHLLKEASPANTNKLYYYFVPTTHYYPFRSTERTIKQLENSGGFRLFKNLAVSDSITSYYELVQGAADQQATWLRYFDIYHEQEYQIFSWSEIDNMFYNRDLLLSMDKRLKLKTYEKNVLDVLFSKAYTMSMITSININNYKELYAKGSSTLHFLSNKYKPE